MDHSGPPPLSRRAAPRGGDSLVAADGRVRDGVKGTKAQRHEGTKGAANADCPCIAGWTLRHGGVDFSAGPVVMGVLNVTPDSFSDGGRFLDPDDALRRADEIVDEGGQIIDLGAESTRPGADPVPPGVQIERLAPVIAGIRRRHPNVPISIDSQSASVARAAIDLGADIINDVSALRRDNSMASVAAETKAPVILMHMRGRPRDMQTGLGEDAYDDVVSEIVSFLTERVAFAESQGIPRTRVAIDPGIGFGKTVNHNLQILGHLDAFVALGLPVLIGASRKRFLGTLVNLPDPDQRVAGSLACVAAAVLAGVQIIRVHDVRESVEAARLANAIRKARWKHESD